MGRNKGYFNCGTFKPPAITVKITRYLAKHRNSALRRAPLFPGIADYEMRVLVRAHCELNIMPETLQNHLRAVDLLRCTDTYLCIRSSWNEPCITISFARQRLSFYCKNVSCAKTL